MNVLFIVDNSLSNPVLSSQGIPHIQVNSKKGINFFILSFEDDEFLKVNQKARERYNYALSELSDFAKIISIKFKYNKRFSTIRFLFKGIFICIKIVKKNKIKIIHGRSNLPSLIGLFVKKIFNVKVLYDNRGLFSDEIDKQNRLRIKIELLFEKYLLSKSDSIVVVSNAFKKYLCEKFPDLNLNVKINIIANSFSEKRFSFSDEFRIHQREKNNLNDRFIMVYSGPSVNWQRFDFIIETFKILKSLRKDAFFLIISYDQNIEKEVVNAGINKTDFSVYDLPPSEVNKYLMMGDFGVIFRDDRMRSKVCAPIKLGEYLASGLPILSMNDIGDTSIILNKYRTGIIIEDKLKIKTKLAEIFELVKEPDVKLRCIKTAEEFLSLKVAAKSYLNIYSDMLSIS